MMDRPEPPPVVDATPPPVIDAEKPNAGGIEIEAVPRAKPARRQFRVPPTFGTAVLAIFDFRFRYFVTPWIVKIQWAICVGAAAGFLLFLGTMQIVSPLSQLLPAAPSGFSPPDVEMPATPRTRSGVETAVDSLPFMQVASRVLAASLVAGLLASALLYVRVLLEGIIVLFRIAEDLAAIREIGEREN